MLLDEVTDLVEMGEGKRQKVDEQKPEENENNDQEVIELD